MTFKEMNFRTVNNCFICRNCIVKDADYFCEEAKKDFTSILIDFNFPFHVDECTCDYFKPETA